MVIDRRSAFPIGMFVLLLACLLSLFYPAAVPVDAAKSEQPSQFSVVPNSNLAGEPNVEYTVGITVGKKSKLKKGDTITFIADPGVLPTSIQPGKITINNVPTAVASKGDGNGKISITSPVHVNQNGQLTIVFSGGEDGAGLTNPGTGERSFSISSNEITKSSTVVTFVAAPLDDLSVTPNSNIPKANDVEYKITFNAGKAKLNTDDSVKITAAPGFFSRKTTRPGAVLINNTHLRLITVSPDGSELECKIPKIVNPGETVEMWLKGGPEGAGITNPDSGHQTLKLSTSKHEEFPFEINYEQVTPKELLQLSVVSSSTVSYDKNVEYQISFNTGQAALLEGDTITFETPAAVVPTETIPVESILINGVSPTRVIQGTNKIAFEVPVAIGEGQDVTVRINSGDVRANFSNPGPGEQVFTIHTNRHNPNRVSLTFIELPISLSDFTITPQTMISGEMHQEYRVSFKTGRVPLQKGDYVTFATSPGVFLTKDIPAGKITINGVPTDTTAKGNGNNYVKMIMPVAVGPNQSVEIVFSGGVDGSGLRNPGIGTKAFTIITANYPRVITTLTYTGEPLRDGSMDVSSLTSGYHGAKYSFRFTTSPKGLLRVGDQIFVYAPKGVLPQQPIAAGQILVNGIPTKVESKTYKTYVIISSPVEIAAGTNAEVVFAEGAAGANLRNPGVGTSKFLVWTTFDDRATISCQFNGYPVQNASLSTSSTVSGERNVEYTFRFTTGQFGSLLAGDNIFVYAPKGVFPSEQYIGAGKIFVNGVPTSVDVKVYGTYVIIPSPVDVNAQENVEITFRNGVDGVNMRNPGDGLQKFLVWTAYDDRQTIPYSFAGTPVQNVTMSTSSTIAGERDVEYTFQFETGTNGDFSKGGMILVYGPKGVFPQGTTIPAGKILVNDVATDKDIPVTSAYVIVPSPVDIGLNQAVRVTFLGGADGARLRNPGGGLQRFLVWTAYNSRQTISYEFAGQSVQNLEMNVSTNKPGQTNAEYKFTFQLTANGELNQGDLITIYTPPSVLPGATIPAGKITVNGYPTSIEAKGNGINSISVPVPITISNSQFVEVVFLGGEEGARLSTPLAGKKAFVLWTPYDSKATTYFTFGDVKGISASSNVVIPNIILPVEIIEIEVEAPPIEIPIIEEEIVIPEIDPESELPEIVLE